MAGDLKYMPIFRARQEEIKALKNLDFGDRIYPCIEIFRELIRKSPKPRKNSNQSRKKRTIKTFEGDYLALIFSIKADQVFVDLPVHLRQKQSMNEETLTFLRRVVAKRDVRTSYMNKFANLSHKVIPVISTYAEITGERNSLVLQEADLRAKFDKIAFRTFFNTYSRDMTQIMKVYRPEDYVIMDLEDMELDPEDEDLLDLAEALDELDCKVIIHKNPISKNLTNKGLIHNDIVRDIDNSLIEKYRLLKGDCFSDYAGIKKDDIETGGTISPGFVFYDASQNRFYGFRYEDDKRELEEFETTIVPAVINSRATERMKLDELDFLGADNAGWEILKNIELGEGRGGESGKSPAKFKRIGLEHYVHCIKCRIINGDFDY